MTMVGAIRCTDGVVVLADRQESITDYAKWDVNKIKAVKLNGVLQIVMTGAGPSDTIDMMWEKVSRLWGQRGSDSAVVWTANLEQRTIQQWREKIIGVVQNITKKCIVPWHDSAYGVDLIWMIQDLSSASHSTVWPFELFRTWGLNETEIKSSYFGGNPVLLVRYLSDFYLKSVLVGLEEARALAAYFLWEAKEYDPTVGKQSDIVTFRRDGTTYHMSYEELSYWEDHFRVLKREMAILPVLSCATTVTRQIYDGDERMGRLSIALRTLIAEQEKMRTGKRGNARIDKTLVPRIRKHAKDFEKRRAKKMGLTLSASQTPAIAVGLDVTRS